MSKTAVLSSNLFVVNLRADASQVWLKYKKAMKRLSQNNFLLNLFIAFFIVLIATIILNFAYRGLTKMENGFLDNNNKTIYMMEKG